MSSLEICGIIFACIFGGALLGMILRSKLPPEHLSPESRNLVGLSMGLIGTMTALVLGLLVASAKNSFDTQRNGLAQLSAKVIFLDRMLAHYGKESKEARAMIKASVDDMLQRTWPEEHGQSKLTGEEAKTEGRYEALLDQIQELKPKNDSQRAFQAQALKIALDIGQARWLLFSQKGRSIPFPFLGVMVCWLTVLLASFSMFAPANGTTLVTLLVCALAVSSALFLILELDQPFQGTLQISSAPLRNARPQLGS
jgi:hypothetical protein